MPDIVNLHDLVGVTIDDRVEWNHEFALAVHLARSAHARRVRQPFDAVDDRLSHRPACVRIVLLYLMAASAVHRMNLRASAAG